MQAGGREDANASGLGHETQTQMQTSCNLDADRDTRRSGADRDTLRREPDGHRQIDSGVTPNRDKAPR
eukprot:2281976-Rhodomonas_salina.1